MLFTSQSYSKTSSRWIAGSFFLGLGLISANAYSASESANELIVRYRAPQDTRAMAIQSIKAAGLTPSRLQVELVNPDQGLIKLRFSTATERKVAETKLALSDQVLDVAPNLLYRPAIIYRFHEAGPRAGFSTLKLPFDLNGSELPDVQPAPTNMTPGADPYAGQDWSARAVHLDMIPDFQGPTNVIAAVIDTGVDYNHEDLSGAMWRNPENPSEVGWDFAHDNAKPYDIVKFDVQGCLNDPQCAYGMDQSKYLVNPGHGTHCAGHVGAVANNSIGIHGMGAPAQVMALKFFYDAGDPNAGQGDDAAAIKSINYAIKHGVRVISASWGGRMPRAEADKSELKKAMLDAQKAGILFVVAAGNDSIDQDSADTPDYPAAYNLDNEIVVAASDQNDTLATFSNFGAQSVHLAAPGVKILSTTVGSHYDDVVAKYQDQSGKDAELDWDGTSMATPIVAGAVARVWAQYPNEDYHQIRDRILRSVRAVPGLQGKVATGGVLDLKAALSQ